MAVGKQPSLLVRLFGEFLAIFLGVVLALTADGWAETRSEKHEARAGFEGLRDANRLRFITNRDLRSRLQDYYQRRQPQVMVGFEATIERVDEIPRITAPYLRHIQDRGAFGLFPLENSGVRLQRPWEEISSDPILYGALQRFGRWAGYTAFELEEGERVLAGLLGAIRKEIEGE